MSGGVFLGVLFLGTYSFFLNLDWGGIADQMMGSRIEGALKLEGERITGHSARQQNVIACQTIANILKSSLGPVGLDKMIVDNIGDVVISNDGATILSLMELEHPAGKLLVELAHQQDKEIGDGTTSTVLLTAELLRLANDLINSSLHATTIISGYRLACKEAISFINEQMAIKVDKLDRNTFLNIAKTSMSSKIISADSAFFSELVVDATSAVCYTNSKEQVKCPIDRVNILKVHGQSAKMSTFVNGYALNCTIASQSMKTKVKDAKIACLDINLQKTRMNMGVGIVINDPDKLEDIRKREVDITLERVKKILAAGANVVLTTKGIDDMCIKLFVDAGAIAVRRVKKQDMVCIANVTGATMISTFANLNGEESFEEAYLGHAKEVVQETIADEECIIIKETKAHSSASIILRGANDYMLDEMERSVHDALCAVKRTYENNCVVAGGGAVESAISVYLENLASTFGSREQLALAAYAHALLIIPNTLATNSAFDSTSLVSKLVACHNRAQSEQKRPSGSLNYGLDLFEGQITDIVKAGVLEPAVSKLNSIKAATEAATALLRIDDMIKVVPPPSPEEAY